MPVGQLATLVPLPSGGYGNPPQIDDVRVDTKTNPIGAQIISQNLQVRAVTITAAQLLALKGADVLLADAPGAGLVIVLQSVSLKHNYGGTAYTVNGGTLKVYLGPSATGIALIGDEVALINNAAISGNFGIPPLETGVQTKANLENQGLYLGNTGAGQFTLGNGTLDVIVTYAVVQA